MIKICDFGSASNLKGKDGSGILTEIVGTTYYMAPEMLEDRKYNGTAVDLFSSAIVLFLMVVGKPPFKSATKNDKNYGILSNPDKRKIYWNAYSKIVKVSDDF